MKKLTLLVFFALLLTNCTAKDSSKTLVLGIMPDVDSIPYVIAEKKGYCAAPIEMVYFKSAKDRDSALQSGQLDGVITDMLAVFFANEGGIKLTIAAKTIGDIKLLASPNSSIKAMKELKGKTIGLSSNTIMEYTADKMLESAGIPPSYIRKAAIPSIPTRLEMLKNDKIDATVLPEPLATLAEKDGALTLCNLDGMEDMSIGVIAFTEKAAKDKKTQIQSLLTGYEKAIYYLSSEPASSYMDFIIQKQGFPERLGSLIELPKYPKIELPSEKNFNSALKWLLDKKLIKNRFEYGAIVGNFF
ncbi:MAG: MetQ/NlpA family ABC transporter substrate-binding protein [Leptospirales bacterium]|nr:MetQ/NlpA family ABC transporter substrate-binding protein [Leptospirales bacterium]